jgi:adenine-specific DNA methylase
LTTQPKRLIEVSLPLKAISAQSAREKSIRHGHISTLHVWWARRPLAAMRAAIFASLVPAPDPSTGLRAGTDEERERPADLIATIVDWDQVNDVTGSNILQPKASRFRVPPRPGVEPGAPGTHPGREGPARGGEESQEEKAREGRKEKLEEGDPTTVGVALRPKDPSGFRDPGLDKRQP